MRQDALEVRQVCPETLIPALQQLEIAYKGEWQIHVPGYSQPTRKTTSAVSHCSTSHAKRLSESYLSRGRVPHIYLKREDLNHTGAHKINNSRVEVAHEKNE
jgi:tryptophan synthase beta chain